MGGCVDHEELFGHRASELYPESFPAQYEAAVDANMVLHRQVAEEDSSEVVRQRSNYGEAQVPVATAMWAGTSLSTFPQDAPTMPAVRSPLSFGSRTSTDRSGSRDSSDNANSNAIRDLHRLSVAG